MEIIAEYGNVFMILAVVFGLYLTWGIGANDVANAMGTSVGSGAITVKQAIIIAAIFEFAGAFIAGGSVTQTIRKGIINPDSISATPEILLFGMLAAMLDWPYASVVNKIEVTDGNKIRVGREIEGGNQEINDIELPCVLSIQTGINEPRYVGIRGIRKVALVEIPVHGSTDLGLAPDMLGAGGARVKRVDYFVPELGEGAEMLEGSTEEIIDKLIEMLKAKGGIK